jgi:hypothetical protein
MAPRFDPAVTLVDDAEVGPAQAGGAGLGRVWVGNGGSMIRNCGHGASSGVAATAPINAGPASELASGQSQASRQRRPRPWQPVLQASSNPK